MQKQSDSLLWKQISLGDTKAFQTLYEFYIDDLLLFGQKLCSNNDLIQDTLQKLFLYIWDSRSTIVAPKYTKAYLMKSFRNNLLRAIKQEQKISGIDIEEHLKNVTDLTVRTDNTEEIRQMKSALLQLAVREREVLHLRFYQDMGNQDISEIMGISYQSVSNLLQRAIKHMKRLIHQGEIIILFFLITHWV